MVSKKTCVLCLESIKTKELLCPCKCTFFTTHKKCYSENYRNIIIKKCGQCGLVLRRVKEIERNRNIKPKCQFVYYGVIPCENILKDSTSNFCTNHK